ncbi:hypothetical protein PV08_09009 [Exophiala spinifera]|uniref:J domain-containing protein n=1 Tax=Exophiala spinifera TaxID=91928 RepID=A0A0D1ZFF3_9EURO|nr:uncharacterized protein PV08_09009 [Exophiala spinifera]KIW11737.1 hypothetical protein PV08_09009 [Exophiala spinifera]
MAAPTDNTQGLVTGVSQAPKSRHRHGLPTPEGTLAPEDARITADKERMAREARQQGAMPSIIEVADREEAQSKPAFDIGAQDDRQSQGGGDSGSESDESDDGRPSLATDAQAEAVHSVLACSRRDYRKILKLEAVAEDDRQEKENIVNSFTRLGCLTHPDFNPTKGADEAFKRVLKAAKKLGIDQEEINEVKFWDGDELAERELTADGRWVDKGDSMQGVEDSSPLGPTEVHQQIWGGVKPVLGRLMNNPHDEEAVATLKEANTKIVEENIANKVPEAMLNSYTIAIDTFKAIFAEAAPILARLRENLADSEARAKFEALNDRLRAFNRLHQYPEGWIMDPPAANASKPAIEGTGLQRASVTAVTTSSSSSDIVSTSTTSSSAQDGPITFRRSTRKEGYVKEHGVEKKIEGAQKVGAGHQLLISRPGNHNLKIYELVAASTFGKGFGAAYLNQPDAKLIGKGKKEDLKDMKIKDMVIAGVASTRRDPSRASNGGRVREPNTIVLVGFGEQPGQFTWYDRSVLGA